MRRSARWARSSPASSSSSWMESGCTPLSEMLWRTRFSHVLCQRSSSKGTKVTAASLHRDATARNRREGKREIEKQSAERRTCVRLVPERTLVSSRRGYQLRVGARTTVRGGTHWTHVRLLTAFHQLDSPGSRFHVDPAAAVAQPTGKVILAPTLNLHWQVGFNAPASGIHVNSGAEGIGHSKQDVPRTGLDAHAAGLAGEVNIDVAASGLEVELSAPDL